MAGHRPDEDGDRGEEARGSPPRILSRLQPAAPPVALLHKNAETLVTACSERENNRSRPRSQCRCGRGHPSREELGHHSGISLKLEGRRAPQALIASAIRDT